MITTLTPEVVTGLLLVLCPLGWVALDLLRKLIADRAKPVPLTALLVAAQIPPFLVWGLVEGDWRLDAGYWWPGMASMVVNIVANLAYMQAVRRSPMSATVPLLSLTPAFATVLAVPLLGEIPGARQALGVLVVVLGALVLNSQPGHRVGPSSLLRALRVHPGAPYMLLVAFLWSVTPALDKLALAHSSLAMHALVLSVGIAGSLVVLLGVQGRLAELRIDRTAWWLVVAAGLVAVVALSLQLAVIQREWVGLVETMKRGIGAVAALVLGRLVFKETIGGRRWLAVVLMTVGVLLVVRW